MALTKKTKICVVPGCGKEFQPTGNCQKRCPEHLKVKVPSASADAKKTVPNAKIIRFYNIADSEKVLQLLIAAGFVTEEKVQQARALLK